MQLKFIFISIFIICLLVLAVLFLLGRYSQNQPPRTQDVAILDACPASLNCVCSEYPQDQAHYVEAIDLLNITQINDLSLVAAVITSMGGDIVVKKQDYLSVTFKSRIFGFVDDFEIRLDNQNNRLHIRSASRVGRSDLGANKLRVEAFRKEFESRF